MRPFKRNLIPSTISYSHFYNALTDNTGEYCHFCEKTLRNGGQLFHRNKGVLDVDTIVTANDWTDLFLVCDDCAAAVQREVIIKKPGDKVEDDMDLSDDTPVVTEEDADWMAKVFIPSKKKQWVLPSGEDACLWPDDPEVQVYRNASLLLLSENMDVWRVVDRNGTLISEEIRPSVALQPVDTLEKELAAKLWNTIHHFKLNGFYLSTHPSDHINRVYYIPEGQQFNDMRLVMRRKVIQLASRYLDQMNILAKFAYLGAQPITNQFKVLQELYGYWSVWAVALKLSAITGEPAPVSGALTDSLLSIVREENRLKRKKDDKDKDDKKPKPEEPELGDTPDEDYQSEKKKRKPDNDPESNDQREGNGDDMNDE
ncbi:hypothetical protein [Chitinophaga flava]|uniref:Uncharacterized protein n=1 Tax=Chitinophaga flava TaxID=2259036 RepID=A0A365XVL0_9BACT|nr:hypothetical protein [Chitinophaga flava]RBL89625.1 hypothetical protein DF182_24290 [Chitinophaga flava]